MDKKTYVLQLLKKLEPYRVGFSDLIVNVEMEICNKNDLEQIMKIIHEQIKNVKDEKVRTLFVKTQALLEKIQAQELLQRQQEETEIDQILWQL